MNKRIFFILLAVLALATTAMAQQHVPAKREPIEVEQPNGQKLTILLRGDEHMHWTMTEDGYLIGQNKKGFYCYKVEKRGEQIVGRKVAKNKTDRTKCDNRYLEKHGIKK